MVIKINWFLILGHLIHSFSGENALAFIECGLLTEGREWVGIDQWRMDKFMMLTRRYIRQIFTYLAKSNWEEVKKITEIFSSSVISNPKATLGFRLHFTDVYLEEVAKAGGEEMNSDILLNLIGNYFCHTILRNYYYIQFCFYVLRTISTCK